MSEVHWHACACIPDDPHASTRHPPTQASRPLCILHHAGIQTLVCILSGIVILVCILTHAGIQTLVCILSGIVILVCILHHAGIQTLVCILSGWVAAKHGGFDTRATIKLLNLFVLRLCLPSLQIWLLAIKTDMRHMDNWK